MLSNILNIIIAVVGIAILVAGIWERKKQKTRWSIAYIVMGALLITTSSSFKIIPTGYTGVKTTLGQVESTVLYNGFCTKIPFIQSIKTVNIKKQDSLFEGEIWGESADKTEVLVSDVIVTYSINPQKTVYIYSNISNTKNLIQQTLVNSAIKSATIKLSTENVTNRNMIEKESKETLQAALDEKYEKGTIYILKITIDNMDFTEEYNDAIAAKTIAMQDAEKQRVDNQKAKEKATADKEKAQIEAEIKQIQAQADAEALKKAAEAEAYAYKVKSAEITDQLLKKWEMDARIAHGWVTVQGAGTIVTNK